MGLQEKLETLRDTKWKCTVRAQVGLECWLALMMAFTQSTNQFILWMGESQVKRELLKEHARTWKKNGLKSVRYEPMDAVALSECCTKITLELGPNDHWSDARSSLDPDAGEGDTQRETGSAGNGTIEQPSDESGPVHQSEQNQVQHDDQRSPNTDMPSLS